MMSWILSFVRRRRRAMAGAFVALFVQGSGEGLGRDPGQMSVQPIASKRRFVKGFDFDERARGNLEDVPIFWIRQEGKEYPHYARGGFDEKEGYPSGPSFFLEPNGGNIAFAYHGKEIPVQPDSDYEITAWIKPKDLVNARASVRAFFLNRGGQRIEGSERQSELIRSVKGSEAWQRVRIRLPGSFPEARFIALNVSVRQPTSWQEGPRPPKHIARVDVRGSAWFDQIEVYRLPQAELASSARSQVFEPDQVPSLTVKVLDPDGVELGARLKIRSAAGETVLEKGVPIKCDRKAEADTVVLKDLTCGLYSAGLEVKSGDRTLIHQELHFAKLAERLRPRSRLARGFGIVMREVPRKSWRNEYRLIRATGISHVKVPIWRSCMSKEAISRADGEVSALVQGLVRNQMHVTGVLGEAPQSLVKNAVDQEGSLIGLLDSDPRVWSPYLKLTVSRYATLISYWQLGQDGDETQAWEERFPPVLGILRKEISRQMPDLKLSGPWFAGHVLPEAGFEADSLSVTIPPTLPPEAIVKHLSELRKQRPRELWAVVSGLPPAGYRRIPRLADLAKRLLYSHAAGSDVVFIMQPWQGVPWAEGSALEPTEDYVVFRTVADALCGTAFAGRIDLGADIECLVFDNSDEVVLALWDNGAGEGGRSHLLPLGNALDVVDLWGNRRRLASDGDHTPITLDATPVFVIGVDRWLARLIASMRLSPRHLESAFEVHRHEIEFVNPRTEGISGTLSFAIPKGWNVKPRQLPFVLRPNQKFREEVRIRFPQSTLAGPHALGMEMQLDADRQYGLTIPLRLDLGLKEIRVWTLAQVDEKRDRVIIRQEITNQSAQPVSLRGFVLAPEMPPRRLMIPHVGSGQMVVREYVLPSAKKLQGRPVRVGLQDRLGGRVYNEEVVVP